MSLKVVSKFNKKNILIIGLGKTGISAYNFFSHQESSPHLIITDTDISKKNQYPHYNFQNLTNIDYKNIDYVFISPGISLHTQENNFLKLQITKYKIPILGDIELNYLYNNSSNYIGITGTNGKSTTTSLIYHILEYIKSVKKESYKNSICGNIGIPILSIQNMKKKDNYIVETSSYQLERLNKSKFNIACLLNITADHLEHHNGFKNYILAKSQIFNNQTKKDFAVISIDDAPCLNIYKNLTKNNHQIIIPISIEKNIESGIYIDKNNYLINNLNNKNIKVYNLSHLFYLKGKHNYQNIAFAYAVAKIKKISNKLFVEALSTFKGLTHRQTLIGNFKNLTFINDSKATNQESTKFALEAFDNIYWILGGIEKVDNLDLCIPLLTKVKKCFLIGKSSNLFYKILHNKVECFQHNTLQNAINQAIDLGLKEKSPITILFSPACASFDMFKNFEDRGNQFTDIVKSIINV
jgi:UDP-N-acetylmuramoylalanine--D-glutamate ligase